MAEFHSARQVASVCEDMLYERVKLEAERLDWLLEKSPGPIDVKSRDGSRLLGPDLKITTAEKYVVRLELKYFGRRGALLSVINKGLHPRTRPQMTYRNP